jgi:hypothetical protein
MKSTERIVPLVWIVFGMRSDCVSSAGLFVSHVISEAHGVFHPFKHLRTSWIVSMREDNNT